MYIRLLSNFSISCRSSDTHITFHLVTLGEFFLWNRRRTPPTSKPFLKNYWTDSRTSLIWSKVPIKHNIFMYTQEILAVNSHNTTFCIFGWAVSTGSYQNPPSQVKLITVDFSYTQKKNRITISISAKRLHKTQKINRIICNNNSTD